MSHAMSGTDRARERQREADLRRDRRGLPRAAGRGRRALAACGRRPDGSDRAGALPLRRQLPGARRPGRLRDRQGRDRADSAEAAEAIPADDPAGRLVVSASVAFRRWAHAQPARVLAGLRQPDRRRRLRTPRAAHRRHVRPLLPRPAARGLAEARFPHPELSTSSTRRSPRRSTTRSSRSTSRTIPDGHRGLLWVFMRAWAALYGVVTLEVFGHMDPRIIESGAMFTTMMRDWLPQLGLADEHDRLEALVALTARRLAPRPTRGTSSPAGPAGPRRTSPVPSLGTRLSSRVRAPHAGGVLDEAGGRVDRTRRTDRDEQVGLVEGVEDPVHLVGDLAEPHDVGPQLGHPAVRAGREVDQVAGPRRTSPAGRGTAPSAARRACAAPASSRPARAGRRCSG